MVENIVYILIEGEDEEKILIDTVKKHIGNIIDKFFPENYYFTFIRKSVEIYKDYICFKFNLENKESITVVEYKDNLWIAFKRFSLHTEKIDKVLDVRISKYENEFVYFLQGMKVMYEYIANNVYNYIEKMKEILNELDYKFRIKR